MIHVFMKDAVSMEEVGRALYRQSGHGGEAKTCTSGLCPSENFQDLDDLTRNILELMPTGKGLFVLHPEMETDPII